MDTINTFNVFSPLLILISLVVAFVFVVLSIIAVIKRVRASQETVETKKVLFRKITKNIILATVFLVIAVWGVPFLWRIILLQQY